MKKLVTYGWIAATKRKTPVKRLTTLLPGGQRCPVVKTKAEYIDEGIPLRVKVTIEEAA